MIATHFVFNNKPQSLVDLRCKKCGKHYSGLTNGPGDSARSQLRMGTTLTVCPDCRTPEEQRLWDDAVMSYYRTYPIAEKVNGEKK